MILPTLHHCRSLRGLGRAGGAYADLDTIEEGQEAVITSGTESGKRGDGRIIFISPLVDPNTRSARVVAEIDNKTMIWRPGAVVTANVAISKSLWKSAFLAQRSRRLAASAWSSCGHPAGFKNASSRPGGPTSSLSRSLPAFLPGTDCSQKHIPAQGRAWQRRKRIRQSASEIAAVISAVLSFSVHQRWLVALLTMAAAAFGVWSMTKLPIDAVPDITSNQVQINTIVPALSPLDVEKQVTYPLETSLTGIPGLEFTRSFSRNGFSQITAVFDDKTDIYFARQQINERLTEAKAGLPPGAEPRMGPVSTGLGEIYMWTVHYKRPGEGATVEDGKPGWQSDGSYLTPEGERFTTDLERTAYLRTVQDWIIRPQLRTVPGIAGVDSLGGFQKQYHVQPNPAKHIGLDLSFGDVATAIENNNLNRGAKDVEDNGEAYAVRSAGRLTTINQIGDVVVATRGGVPVRVKDLAEVKIGRELRAGSASENGKEAVIGTALMLIGGDHPQRICNGRYQDEGDQQSAAASGRGQDGFEPNTPCGRNR